MNKKHQSFDSGFMQLFCVKMCINQSWALPLQVAVIRYLANSERISEIADLKSSEIAVAYC
jgi:hypothetical protein